MRDKERIGPLLAKLRVYWERNPDLRLCQILTNFFSKNTSDLFFIEDGEVEQSLDREAKTANRRTREAALLKEMATHDPDDTCRGGENCLYCSSREGLMIRVEDLTEALKLLLDEPNNPEAYVKARHILRFEHP